MKLLVKDTKTVGVVGSVTTIMSDKTGVLTQNCMSVYRCIVNKGICSCDLDHTWPLRPGTQTKNLVWDGIATPYIDVTDPTVQVLLRCVLMCNRTVFADRIRDERVLAANGKQVWVMPDRRTGEMVLVNIGCPYDDRTTREELNAAHGRIGDEWIPLTVEFTEPMWVSEIKFRSTMGDASEEGMIRFLEELRHKERELVSWTAQAKSKLNWFEGKRRICRPVFMYDVATASAKAIREGCPRLRDWEATLVPDAGQDPTFLNMPEALDYRQMHTALGYPRRSSASYGRSSAYQVYNRMHTEVKEAVTWEFKGGAGNNFFDYVKANPDDCCPYIDIIKAKYPEAAETLQFNSRNKYMVVVREMEQERFTFFIKGGHDVVLNMFVADVEGGRRRAFDSASADEVTGSCLVTENGRAVQKLFSADPQHKIDVQNCVDEMSYQGERVLGFIEMTWTVDELRELSGVIDCEALSSSGKPAHSLLPGKLNDNFMRAARARNKLVYLGAVSLMDPPRTEVPSAVQLCHSAGIRVAMISGDHPKTSRAIATKIGIIADKGNAWARFVTNESRGQGDYFKQITPRETDSDARPMQYKTEWRRNFEKARLIEQLIIFGEDAPAYTEIVPMAAGKAVLQQLAMVADKGRQHYMQYLLKQAFKDSNQRQGDKDDYRGDCLMKLVAAVPDTADAKEARKLLDRMVDNFKNKFYSDMRRAAQDPTWDLDDITPAATKKEAKVYVPEMAAAFYAAGSPGLLNWDSGEAKRSKYANDSLVRVNMQGHLEATEDLVRAVEDAKAAETPLYQNLRSILTLDNKDRRETDQSESSRQALQYYYYNKYAPDFEAYYEWCSEVTVGADIQKVVDTLCYGEPDHPADLQQKMIGNWDDTKQLRVHPTLAQFFDKKLIKPDVVFARAQPEQKQLIVRNLQRDPWNEVVAVSGDSTGDAPALKTADCGVALGIAGSEVALKAANMILRDDSFGSIVTGVEIGRICFNNVKKGLVFSLCATTPTVVPFAANIFLGWPLALDPRMIPLLIVVAVALPAPSLAWEKSEFDVMRGHQKTYSIDNLVDRALLLYSYVQIGLLESACALGAFFYSLPRYVEANGQEEGLRKAQTICFFTLVTSQAAVLVGCKTRFMSVITHGFGNMFMNAALALMLVFGLTACFIAPGTSAPPASDLFKSALSSFVIVTAAQELRKFLTRFESNGWSRRSEMPIQGFMYRYASW
eukprot:SAG31_NODE_2933_length_4896_cov_3.091724_2_plen_1213_part_00